MALTIVVETGAIVPNANSYISIEDMQGFWDNWGYDYSTLTDAQINLLLYSSAETLDTTYYDNWPGERADDEQYMEWPRSFAYYQDGESIDSDEIPVELKKAQAKICYLINAGYDLQPIITTEGTLKSKREKVDVIETEYAYDSNSSAYINQYTSLSLILVRLIGHTGRYGKLRLQRN